MSTTLQRLLPGLGILWPVFAGLAAAYLISGFAQYRSIADISPGVQLQTGAREQDSVSWEGMIMEKNILGLEMPEHKPRENSMSESSGPDSWLLLGALTGTRELALVSVDGETVLASPGQSIDGWELSRINPGETVWVSGIRKRTLKMWQGDDTRKQSRLPGRTDRDVQHGSQRVSLSSSDVQPFLNDPNSLLQMAHFRPYVEDGENLGFEITSIRSGSMLQNLGMRNGDILTRIDGRSITGPTELLRAYSSLTQSSLVTMDIQRQGQNLSLVLEIY